MMPGQLVSCLKDTQIEVCFRRQTLRCPERRLARRCGIKKSAENAVIQRKLVSKFGIGLNGRNRTVEQTAHILHMAGARCKKAAAFKAVPQMAKQ
jgi:hypothetical protein